MSCQLSSFDPPQGWSIDSVEQDPDDLFFIPVRYDGRRPPVRSVDSALMRALRGRLLAMKIALG